MFEFYNDLSVLGKLIFYFSVLIIICSVFYQCYFCTMMPVKLTWNYPASHSQNSGVTITQTPAAIVPQQNASDAPPVYANSFYNSAYETFQDDSTNSLSVSPIGRSRSATRPARPSRNRDRRRSRDPSRERSPLDFRKRIRSASRSPARQILSESNSPVWKQSLAGSRRASKNDNATLILFYADWCSHCQNFKPKWNKLTKSLQGIVKTLSVNGDTNQKMLQKYNVDKFPTVILDNGSSKLEYTGDMSIDGLKQFVLTQQNNGTVTQDFVV